MTAPRRGFDVPYGAIAEEGGNPSHPMSEFMDKINQALTTLKTAADGMTELDPSTATASDCANAWESFRASLQGIE